MALLGELVFVAQVYVLLTVLDIYWVLRQVAVTSAYLIRQRKNSAWLIKKNLLGKVSGPLLSI
jgi:hypothetical protein